MISFAPSPCLLQNPSCSWTIPEFVVTRRVSFELYKISWQTSLLFRNFTKLPEHQLLDFKGCLITKCFWFFDWIWLTSKRNSFLYANKIFFVSCTSAEDSSIHLARAKDSSPILLHYDARIDSQSLSGPAASPRTARKPSSTPQPTTYADIPADSSRRGKTPTDVKK